MITMLVLSSALILIFVVSFIQVYCWYKVHTYLRLPQSRHDDTPEKYGLSYQTKTFQSKNGATLEGWYIPVNNAKTVVIIVHGNLEARGSLVKHAKYLHDAGHATFLIDLSTDAKGKQVTLGIKEYQDVIAAYELMQSLPENKNKKIGFFGGSMGASVSIIAAGKTGKGDFIIASVPYANFKNLLIQRIKLEKLPSLVLPFVQFAVGFELGWKYESFAPDKFVASIRVPIFLISSAKDSKVDGNDAELLYEKATLPKYFWRAEAEHDVYKDLPEEYQRRILEFLTTI